MKKVIKLLKKELKSWKEQYASDKEFLKALPNHPEVKKSCRECKKHIVELESAIKILMNAAPKSGT